MQLLVPSAYGIEAVVKRQLALLGYQNTRALDGRVIVDDATWTDVARINMFVRSGERVFARLAEFHAATFDELFEGVRAVNWTDYVSPHGKITVITKTVGSALTAHHAIQSIGKKAIVSAFGTLPEDGEEYVVELALCDDVCSVNLDTTGVGLHKRGYRTLPYTAPLKETTAAALIDLSVWNPDKTFTDLFCGSGTLPIEAAMKALRIAPGMNRSFAYQNWVTVPKSAYETALAEAKDSVCARKLNIIGGDVSKKAVEIAAFHAKQAGVAACIKFNIRAAEEFVSKSSYGVNISNPPYGERIGNADEVKQTAINMGKLYRSLNKWNFYFLSPYQDFEKDFGRRADKKRYLYNAGIKCSYYTFCGPKPPKPTT